MNEPVADAVRSILDGHVVLTRALAHAGHYPAIDVLQSVSRLVGEIVPAPVAAAGQRLRSALAVLREKEDLVAIGAYQAGADPSLDTALAHRALIEGFLRQPVDESSTPAEADEALLALAASLDGRQAGEPEIVDAEAVPLPKSAGEDTALTGQGRAFQAAATSEALPAIPALDLSM